MKVKNIKIKIGDEVLDKDGNSYIVVGVSKNNLKLQSLETLKMGYNTKITMTKNNIKEIIRKEEEKNV